MKLVYFNDKNSPVGYLSKMVDDDYRVKSGETMTVPDGSLIPPLTIINGQWQGQDLNPGGVAEPVPPLTVQDKINAHFLKVQLDMQKQLMEMKNDG